MELNERWLDDLREHVEACSSDMCDYVSCLDAQDILDTIKARDERAEELSTENISIGISNMKLSEGLLEQVGVNNNLQTNLTAAEDELNQLMHEKKKNETKAKEEFDKRVKDTKKEAIEKNKKLATETGNKLTQNVTEEGELVNVKEMNTLESQLASDQISTADIRKELFEGENIVTSTNTDHGLSDLLINQDTSFELADVSNEAPGAPTEPVKRRRNRGKGKHS